MDTHATLEIVNKEAELSVDADATRVAVRWAGPPGSMIKNNALARGAALAEVRSTQAS